MANLLRTFLELVENKKSHFINSNVDLSELLDVCNQTTPIMLKYTDPKAAFIDMPSVIVSNFLKNMRGAVFPMYGLMAMREIITKNTNDENARLAMVLMVHVTKMDMSVNDMAAYFDHFVNIVEITGNDVRAWRTLGYKVLAHKGIQKIISKLLLDAFGQQYRSRVNATAYIPIVVKFVHTKEPEIRGYTGFNEVYLNYGHFNVQRTAIDCLELEETVKTNLLFIDIITCIIHEYAHCRARQLTNDLNHSTPQAILSTIGEGDPELGRMAERILFGTSINWRKAFEQKFVDATFIGEFLSAISNGTELPAFPKQDNVPARAGPKLMNCGGGGADIAYVF